MRISILRPLPWTSRVSQRPNFDGRSLLSEWQDESPRRKDEGDAKEIINIELRSDKIFEAPSEIPWPDHNSCKTLRIVSEGSAWLFVKWFSNEIELYNTTVSLPRPWVQNPT